MRESLKRLARWMKWCAEVIAAILATTVFVVFILQIVFRYVLNLPVGWTLEVSTLAWMWLVLWGSAFVVSERDEIRFDILYSAASRRWRRVFTVVTSLSLVALFAVSFPAVVDYVTFMRIERASYINIRLDYLFSVYILFAAATIARYLWLGFAALKGDLPGVSDTPPTGDK